MCLYYKNFKHLFLCLLIVWISQDTKEDKAAERKKTDAPSPDDPQSEQNKEDSSQTAADDDAPGSGDEVEGDEDKGDEEGEEDEDEEEEEEAEKAETAEVLRTETISSHGFMCCPTLYKCLNLYFSISLSLSFDVLHISFNVQTIYQIFKTVLSFISLHFSQLYIL